MRRALAAFALLCGFAMLAARPANPLSVGVDMALHLYQKLISPLQGGHICNFSPSCSAFSRSSYRLYGPFWGTLMTFDRLERCNPDAWRHLDVYYPELRSERLHDPPSSHHLPTRLRERRSSGKTDSEESDEEEREQSD